MCKEPRYEVYLTIAIVFAACIIFSVSVIVPATKPKAENKELIEDTCFPKGVLVKSENMGLVCIDAGAIRWDDTP